MKKHRTVLVLIGTLFAVALYTSSCANVERKSFTPRSHDDLPAGKGLFTGEDGEVLIYSK
ncbi:MAG: hypothetical protein HY559_02035 [Gammaproteobacteria bacterium]|nr:hypothetical protein [Gammaproteobacteria bacterium]